MRLDSGIVCGAKAACAQQLLQACWTHFCSHMGWQFLKITRVFLDIVPRVILTNLQQKD